MQSVLRRLGTLVLDSPAKAFPGPFALFAVILIGCFLVLMPALVLASPGVSIDVQTGYGSFPPNKQITGTIDVIHDEFIPSTAAIEAYIDNVMVATVPVGNLLPGVSNYSFPTYRFSYNLTSSGNNTWDDFSDQVFDYSIDVFGTCGQRTGQNACCNVTESRCWCDCESADYGPQVCPSYDSGNPSTIPCDWTIIYPRPWKSSSVNGNEGLKLIDDFSGMTPGFGLPGHSNVDDTFWTETTNSDPGYSNRNPNVATTMREACGSGTYDGQLLGQDGWVHDRTLDVQNWNPIGAHRRGFILKFDHNSLLGDRGLYTTSNIGGIYQNGNYLSYSPTEAVGSAFWNGTSGEIIIYWYDDQSTYTITYLPPNGPMLCAYSGFSTRRSEEWFGSTGPFPNRPVRYDSPFSSVPPHDLIDFPFYGLAKSCPTADGSCNSSTYALGVEMVEDLSGLVALGFDSSIRTVTATTSSRDLTNNYTGMISLDDVPGINTASGTGHTLRIDLRLSGQVLASDNTTFGICSDADGDGFCATPEGGGDCDDSSPLMNPSKPELCNGIDDDCDGIADDGYFVDGKTMGSHCGGANGTACRGTWRCSQDGLQAICFTEFDPGELNEICGNDLDDDCDGEVDELMKLNGDPDCWCELGKREDCGSNIGICRQGTRLCEIGSSGRPEWSICRDAVGSQIEVCNQDDDDCDGYIDDVNGGKSISSSKCGCNGGLSPTPEICNDIDDDCNGQIDDGITCCTDGETRQCGSDVGMCEMGTQTCVAGSWQTSVCVDEVRPRGEICYNGQDDNCDGRIDGGCDPEYTCQNGIQDLNENGIDCGEFCPDNCMSGPFWMIVAGVAILLLLVMWLLVMRHGGE
jgi:hypothetical protein